MLGLAAAPEIAMLPQLLVENFLDRW